MLVGICDICKKEYKEYPNRASKRKFCSHKCYWKSKKGHTPWNKGKSVQINTGKTHFKKGNIPWNKNIKHKAILGKNHWNWKGDRVGYHGLHQRIGKKFGKSDTCEHCKMSNLKGQEIHWANISGKYTEDRKDWLRLCIPCHNKYDSAHATI